MPTLLSPLVALQLPFLRPGSAYARTRLILHVIRHEVHAKPKLKNGYYAAQENPSRERPNDIWIREKHGKHGVRAPRKLSSQGIKRELRDNGSPLEHNRLVLHRPPTFCEASTRHATHLRPQQFARVTHEHPVQKFLYGDRDKMNYVANQQSVFNRHYFRERLSRDFREGFLEGFLEVAFPLCDAFLEPRPKTLH